MELTGKSNLRAGLGSRKGVMIIATVASVLAAVLVLVALNSARNDNGGSAPATAIVANQLIPKGSSGQAIAEGKLYRSANVSEGALVGGAVTDISQLRGKVATSDIFPGQQITVDDFAGAGGALTADLTANNRAISIPLDSAHGLIGDVRAGDRVDVLSGFNAQNSAGATRAVLKVLDRNVVVLKAPSDTSSNPSSGDTQDVTLRVTDRKAAQIAFAADNGKVWLVLRPAAGSSDSNVDIVSLQSLLVGVKAQPTGSSR